MAETVIQIRKRPSVSISFKYDGDHGDGGDGNNDDDLLRSEVRYNNKRPDLMMMMMKFIYAEGE
jgi:hypothetical protein